MCHDDKSPCNDKMENAKVVISKDAYYIIANKVEQFMIMVKAITESKACLWITMVMATCNEKLCFMCSVFFVLSFDFVEFWDYIEYAFFVFSGI